MTIIKTLRGLEKCRQTIETYFVRSGKIYLQNYFSFEANFKSKKNGEFLIFIDEDYQLLTAFEKKSDFVWQCSISAYPVLSVKNIKTEILIGFFEKIKKTLKVETLYFPLVYKNDENFSKILKVDNLYFWPRLPSPIIKGDFSELTIWKRVESRYGSRAKRQKKKFEGKLYIRSLKMNEVEKIIKRIEINSWKNIHQQDMLSRGNQFGYYTNIIKSGLAEISVAFDKETDEAAAFRIDSQTNKSLYVLKWSYNEKFSRYSPGFYLLVVDLFKKYSSKNFSQIDLYGSPDMLKNLLETERLDRADYCYSTNLGQVKSIKEERIKFDQKIFINYQEQKSLKKLFL